MNKEVGFCKLVIDTNGEIAQFICHELNIPFCPQTSYAALGFEIEHQLIGGVLYSDITINEDVWISIIAMDKRWCNRRILKAIFASAFGFWNCHRINALIDTDNQSSLKLALGVGFKKEGIMRSYRNAKDVYVLGMLAEECQFYKKGEQENVQ